MIDLFRGDYRFLSNFELCEVVYDGIAYPSSENAYQAAKCLDSQVRLKIITMTPGQAKREGQKAITIVDWHNKKFNIMQEIVLYKFTHNEILRQKLLATGTEELVEGNTWNDIYWGVCNGVGENNLGKILMEVREILRK